jgi:predicted cupin superfamily sugar epimerase
MGKGGTPQAVMKARTWFAASLDNKKSYCLVGCTMSPGFDYRDWELGKRAELVKMYPQHKKLIGKYTR